MRAEAMTTVEHLSVEANGLRFYLAASGPQSGELVLLLHGFPELSYGWRHQVGPLAAAGFRVVAPDQRGYGHSDKPKGRHAYTIDKLADDVIGVADALGRERFRLVGHDWGGIVSWYLASRRPRHVERLAILNAPHPAAAWRHTLWNPTQALKSAYVAAFQLPLLPEIALSAGNGALLASALRGTSRPGTFSEAELDVYRQAWCKEGALTSMLNWYRALPLGDATSSRRVAAPTLVLWGDRDSALDAALADSSVEWCDSGQSIHFPECTHWLQHEEPARVNALLIDFLR
jgi:pimeloyl-ACP methyl ester carboxylesterase